MPDIEQGMPSREAQHASGALPRRLQMTFWDLRPPRPEAARAFAPENADRMIELQLRVYEANLGLVTAGLVRRTFGNVSQVDRELGIAVIKPSGVSYQKMRPSDMVVVSLEDGATLSGGLKPSVDTRIHLELYRAFPKIGGVTHTHSFYATAWAQAGKAVPALGTTHSDYFRGPVPCTRDLTPAELGGDYERSIAASVAECFSGRDPAEIPAVLVMKHGPFTWGRDAAEAVLHAEMLEISACLASHTVSIDREVQPVSRHMLELHFTRKHGPRAWYGQRPPP